MLLSARHAYPSTSRQQMQDSVGQLPDGRTTTLFVAQGSPTVLVHAGSFSLPNELSICNVCVCATATKGHLLFSEMLGQKQKLHGVVQFF